VQPHVKESEPSQNAPEAPHAPHSKEAPSPPSTDHELLESYGFTDPIHGNKDQAGMQYTKVQISQ